MREYPILTPKGAITMKKFITFLLILTLLTSLAGCGEVAGEIAGNVAEAARKELENQIKQTFETYKIDILDMKSAVGKLNDANGDIQFFCAVLVQSESPAIPQSAADTLAKLFHDAGIHVQSGAKIDNDYLQNKELSFKLEGDGATHYTVWFYTDKLPTLEDLKGLKDALSTEGVG